MIIKLSKDCRIVGEDGIQFTLQIRKIVSDKPVKGKVSDRAGSLGEWKSEGYYGTLSQALNSTLKKSLMHSTRESNVKDLIHYLNQVTTRIEKACEGLLTARSAAEFDGTVVSEELDALFNEE